MCKHHNGTSDCVCVCVWGHAVLHPCWLILLSSTGTDSGVQKHNSWGRGRRCYWKEPTELCFNAEESMQWDLSWSTYSLGPDCIWLPNSGPLALSDSLLLKTVKASKWEAGSQEGRERKKQQLQDVRYSGTLISQIWNSRKTGLWPLF